MKASKPNLMVFRLYMAVIKKNLGYIFTYFAIFVTMAVLFAQNQGEQSREMFRPVSVPIPVMDRDQSAASKGLMDFLALNNEVYLFEGEEQELSRGLYYREIGYILTIPEGFGDSLAPDAAGEVSPEAVKLPGDSAVGYYIDAEIRQFMQQYRAYLAAGFSPEESGQHVLDLQEKAADVRIENAGNTLEEKPSWVFTLNYLAYLYLSVFIFSVSNVLKSFRDRHVADRMGACPIPARTQALQGFLAFGLVFAGVWIISLMVPLLSGGAGFYASPHRGLLILNSLAFLLVAASIAFLVGNLVKSEVAISALTNVIGLGMCFLGGVFVPLNIMGEKIQKFSRLLPTNWYVRVCDLLGTRRGALSGEDLHLVQESLLIQCAFAAAIFAMTLFLVRQRGRDH